MAASSSDSSISSSSSSSSSQTSSSTSATPTTSASPTTTTTNGSTSTSPTSSQTSSSTGSSDTSTQSSSTTSSTSSTTSATQLVTSSGGQLETITSFITPTVTTTPTSHTASSSDSFFSNKGAVAGVFTVVGLVVVGLVIALTVNAIKRRRAQKFDRDVAEAAAEAAASSRSPFDEYSYNPGGNGGGGAGGGGGGGGGGYGYSDNSHGTYNLPPLSPRDTYGMTEMAQYDPYAAAAPAVALAAAAASRSRSRKESEPGAPGLAGVGAGTLAREPSKRAPYHAFAGPAPQPQDLQRGNGTLRSIRGTNQDVLEAAGLAGASLNTGAYVNRRPSETTQNTHFSGRSHSQHFGSMSGHTHPTTLQPGYPVDSYYPQRSDSHSPDPFAGYPPMMAAISQQSLPNPHEVALPSSPPPAQSSDHNEEHTEPGSPTALRSDEQRMSYQDDMDYSQGNRVLRVANE